MSSKLENCSRIWSINLIFVVCIAYCTVNFGTVECLIAFVLIQLMIVLSMPSSIPPKSNAISSSKSHKYMRSNSNKSSNNSTIIYNSFNWLKNWTHVLSDFYISNGTIKSNKSVEEDILSTELTKSRKHVSLLELRQHHQEEQTAKKSNDLRRMIANVAHDLKTVSTLLLMSISTFPIFTYPQSCMCIIAYERRLLWTRPPRESHARPALRLTHHDTRAVTGLTADLNRDYTSSEECK